MSKSRLEKFLYALYSLDSSDLPNPLSRIEELYKCLVTGDEAPTFEPLSRVEKYLMAILGIYDEDELPNPISRVEVLLYKLATGDDNLDDVKSFLSEHEELLAEIIRNGGVGGNIDIEYVLYTLSTGYSTLYNTAEKPVKSAILKGNTLVNIFDNWVNNDGTLTPVKTQDGYFLFTGSNGYAKVNLDDIPTFKRGIGYTFIYRIKNSTYDGKDNNMLRLEVGATTIYAHTVTNGIWKIKKSFSTDETNCFVKILSWIGSTGSAEVSLQIIEGDYTNTDIPYVTGIQSVKMPVLRTVGKNVFDLANSGLREESAYDKSMNRYGVWTFGVQLQPNKKVTISRKNNDGYNLGLNLRIHNENTYTGGTWVIANHAQNENRSSATLTTNSDGYIWFIFSNNFDKINQILDICEYIQFEYGTVATSYEPFKSNILTVNEPVELRGIGGVKDELDLMTGELTQRIGEVILDGNESWSQYNNVEGFETYGYFAYFKGTYKGILCDRFKESSNKNIQPNYPSVKDEEAICMEGDYVKIRIKNISTVADLKLYLSQNPITIQCQLATESIKTVDLSVVNQEGNDTKLSTFDDLTHVTFSSEGLIPEVELEVATKNEEDLEDSIVYTVHTLSEGYNTLYNTAEKPVKSAILKGWSLVNLLKANKNDYIININSKNWSVEDGYFKCVSTTGWHTITDKFSSSIKPNTKYLIVVEIKENTLSMNINFDGYETTLGSATTFLTFEPNEVGTKKAIVTTISTLDNIKGGFFRIPLNITNSNSILKFRVMAIEYQEGMENWDISYFEGMQSVQMPVLTTTGKNIFSPTKMNINDGSLYGYYKVKDDDSVRYTLSLTDKDTSINLGDIYFGASKVGKIPDGGLYWLISYGTVTTSSITTDLNYISIYPNDIETLNKLTKRFNIQIEFSEEKTSYEPYKSNILTVNEEVELRKVGDVQDELNLLTGELTQRIGELVLDGGDDEEWLRNPQNDGENTVVFYIGDLFNEKSEVIIDKFTPYLGSGNFWSAKQDDSENHLRNSNDLAIRISKSKLTSLEVDGFRQWLSQNPITVQHELKEELIKTVDLSVVDQDGNDTKLSTFNDITHVTLSSEGLIPKAELEVAEKVPEVAASMLTISREQEVIDTAANEQSENADATMLATTEIYEGLL